MPVLPFPEWRPDLTPYNINGAETIKNVTPQADGYGPHKSFSAATGALAAVSRGMFFARHSDGTVRVFAGTSTKLYILDNTDLGWDDVSAGAGTYTTLPATSNWQFAQFGLIVIAVAPGIAPQAFTIGSSSEFAALAGSPPQASYIAIVGRFVVLSGLTANPYRVHWSGLGSAITWTTGVNSSDFQDLPDGGIVRGVAGGEYGVIFQENTIRRMIYNPGSTVVFSIEKISDDKGILAPYSLVRAGERIFWLSAQGFYTMTPTGFPTPIGKERFDRYFFRNYDSGALQLVIGAADPETSRVFFAYRSSGGSSSLFDRIICWDFAIERAVLIEQTGEYMTAIAAPGITLENLDSISSNIDALTVSFDDISTGALAKLSMFNSTHVLGFFSGPNMEATLDSNEHQLEMRRMRVKGIRPVTDASSCYGSIGKRETLQTSVSYSDEQAVNDKGLCPAHVSTRLARGRVRIPAATSWTFASGVEPDIALDGKR